MQASRSPDIARTTLQLLALGVLIASSFWILRPFLVDFDSGDEAYKGFTLTVHPVPPTP